MSRDTIIEYGMMTGISSGAPGVTSVLNSIGFVLNIVGENSCRYMALMDRDNLIDVMTDIKISNSTLGSMLVGCKGGGNEKLMQVTDCILQDGSGGFAMINDSISDASYSFIVVEQNNIAVSQVVLHSIAPSNSA